MYNRRSYSEIIDVANSVRNDEIVQKSIYSDSGGGSVKFYYGKSEEVSEFIGMCAKNGMLKMKIPCIVCLLQIN